MAQYDKLINLGLLSQFLTKAKAIFAPKITASGILKGDGHGGVSAAEAGTDYATPGLGLTGASIGDLVRVNAVDSDGKPTSWKHVPLNEIKTQRNYLDNSYFKNAINQRGQSSYTNAGYTIDRWKLISGSISIGTNGLTLDGEIAQILENQIGHPVTCSALLSDGSIMTPTYDDSMKTFTLIATGETIIAAKLELGSEQTLAHNEGTEENPVWVLNEIPDYGEELAKCQRYLRQIYTEWPIITGTTSRIACSFILSPPMAKNPTIIQYQRLAWYRYYDGTHIKDITSQTWSLMTARPDFVIVSIACGDKNPTGIMIGYTSGLIFLLSAEP